MPFFIPGLILLEELVQVVVVLGAGAAAAGHLANTPRTVYPTAPTGSSGSATTTYVECKTIWDWWANGLTGEQRDYLLRIGYSDSGSTYALAELKHVAKYREKELLTELSKTYIQQWIDENDYSSGEERDRRERVVNCSKNRSPVWRGKQHYRGDIKTNGKSGSDRRYYRWDNTHNDIEVYDRSGDHLGSMDPRTGKMYKGPVAGRNIRDLL